MPLTDGQDWMTEDLRSVRNEARDRVISQYVFDVIVEHDDVGDLHDAICHLRRLKETPAINADAEQRKQEAITRTVGEIQRLMGS